MDFTELIVNAWSAVISLSAPLLGVSLAVGLVIGFFQTVTQIHEAGIGAMARIFAVGVALWVASGWMHGRLYSLSQDAWALLDRAHNSVPK